MISGSTGLARVRAENGDAYMHGVDRFDIHYLWLVESLDWDNRRQSGADFSISQGFSGLGDSWTYLPKAGPAGPAVVSQVFPFERSALRLSEARGRSVALASELVGSDVVQVDVAVVSGEAAGDVLFEGCSHNLRRLGVAGGFNEKVGGSSSIGGVEMLERFVEPDAAQCGGARYQGKSQGEYGQCLLAADELGIGERSVSVAISVIDSGPSAVFEQYRVRRAISDVSSVIAIPNTWFPRM